MAPGEIVTTGIAFATLFIVILKVWIQTKIDIAKVQGENVASRERQDRHEKDLNDHKMEDFNRFEQIRKDNREDHQILFKKIDELIDKRKN